MSEHYGEEWRRWPGGCKCHGDGAGYFMDYQRYFAAMFEKMERPSPWGDAVSGRTLTLYLCAFPPTGDEATWWWTFGSFSWTPDGEYWDPHLSGRNPTRARAEAVCREAAENWIQRMRASAEARTP